METLKEDPTMAKVEQTVAAIHELAKVGAGAILFGDYDKARRNLAEIADLTAKRD